MEGIELLGNKGMLWKTLVKFIIGSIGEYEWAGIESIITKKKVYEYTLTTTSNVIVFTANIQSLFLIKDPFLMAYEGSISERLKWIKKRIDSTSMTIKNLLTQGNYNEETYNKIKKRFPYANKKALHSILNNIDKKRMHLHNANSINDKIDASLEIANQSKEVLKRDGGSDSNLLFINRISPSLRKERAPSILTKERSTAILGFFKHTHGCSNTDCSTERKSNIKIDSSWMNGSPKRRTIYAKRNNNLVLPLLSLKSTVPISEEGKVIEVCQRKIKIIRFIQPTRQESPNPYTH